MPPGADIVDSGSGVYLVSLLILKDNRLCRAAFSGIHQSLLSNGASVQHNRFFIFIKLKDRFRNDYTVINASTHVPVYSNLRRYPRVKPVAL